MDDLGTVLQETYEARNKWYDIGLGLKVSVATLDGIKSQSDDPKDCLRETLKPWLKGTDPKPTWRALVEALKSCIVEEHQLAKRLEAKYCCDSKIQGEVMRLYYTCILLLANNLFSTLNIRLSSLA